MKTNFKRRKENTAQKVNTFCENYHKMPSYILQSTNQKSLNLQTPAYPTHYSALLNSGYVRILKECNPDVYAFFKFKPF